MEANRLLWLDVAKGMTILLMIVGHTSIPGIISNFIFAFHMPLFFIASGWCTNWAKDNYGDFVLKKMRTLGVPFLVYSFFVISVASFIGYDSITLGGVITKGWEGYALWFVPVLFFSLLAAKSIMSFINRSWLRYAVCILLMLMGAFFRYRHIYLPWTLATVPYATCLVLLGSSLRKFQEYIDRPHLWILGSGLILTSIISYQWRMDMAWNNIIPVVILTTGAIAGTVMMFSIASYVTRVPWVSKIFQAIGKETFIILAFSQILCLTITHYFSLNKMVEYGLMFCLLFVIVLVKNVTHKIIKQKIL